MKWFFALNENNARFQQYADMAKVAVLSAQRHTTLDPVFLYDGTQNELFQWMKARQVTVLQHRSSLFADSSELQPGYSQASGVFLRLDIPDLVQKLGWKDEYILYTDCDILFRQNVDFTPMRPKFFAAAPEINMKDDININSGVMLMNIPNLARTFAGFRSFTKNFFHYFLKLDSDQTAYKCYYYLEWEQLPNLFNWKPYWGDNPQAKVIHFHGPKPREVSAARQSILDPHRQALVCPEYYLWTNIWEQYLQEAEQPFSFPKQETFPLEVDGFPYGDSSENEGVSEMKPSEGLSDMVCAAVLHASPFASFCPKEGIHDWRAVKGSLALWLMDNQQNVEAQLSMSDFFLLIEEFEAEFQHLAFAYRLAPQSSDVLKRMGKNLGRRGKPIEAERCYQAALLLAPQDVDCWISLGKVYYDLQRDQEALDCLRKALALNPQDPDAKQGLEIVARRMKG